MALKDSILEVTRGEHVAAVATVADGRPAVRFMALVGLADLSIIGATMKSSKKVEQIRKNPEVALSIWSGKSFADPYVVIQSKAEIYEDLETKKKFWDPKLESYFQNPENPNYVVLKFMPQRIEYYHEMSMDLWER
ncbi:MAG: pyridoxamine 5'-phosphate oxidase family protein [Methanotrichaceae archaeon]